MIRMQAFRCLADIGTIYYEKIQENLNLIGQVTYQSIKQDEEEVQILALEFWLQLSEEEILRMDDKQHVAGYISTAASSLTPMCLENLHKGFADDDWNLHMACATCINNMSIIAGQLVYD